MDSRVRARLASPSPVQRTLNDSPEELKKLKFELKSLLKTIDTSLVVLSTDYFRIFAMLEV